MLTSSGTVRYFGQVAVLSGLFAFLGVVHPGQLTGADLSLPITGNLVGSVVDSEGVPQMGATIQLLNKYHQAIAKATSDGGGHFAFSSLPADVYSLRASLASFLPVSRDKISVKPGLDSVLQIHLATLISSMEVSYIIPSSVMTDDWKWVLRSSTATRPINRFLSVERSESDSSLRLPIFSETHAALSLMGGAGGPLDLDSPFSDFGTAFAVSTQVLGKNHLQVTGSFGEDQAVSTPAIAISALYSRSGDSTVGNPPEVIFSALQVAGVGTGANPVGAGNAGAAPLRSMSLSIYETLDPVSNVHLEYGATGESFDYLQHSNRVSPFARATVDEGKFGKLLVSYSDGGRPDHLLRHSVDGNRFEDDQVDGDLTVPSASLQRLPQISRRNGALVLQRTRSYEVGYTKVSGSRQYSVSAFSEEVSNGRLSVAGNFAEPVASDILSDTMSRTSIYNVGRYRRTGYLASVYQRFGKQFEAGFNYGQMGAFRAQSPELNAAGTSVLQQTNARFASAGIKTVVPGLGTKLEADYGWMDTGAVMPRHVFTTQRASAAPGLNIYFRQPVPTFLGLPGRLELTADLRNLLSQGYLPVNAPSGGRYMLVVQAAQSVRGGLNFIF